MHEFTLRRKKQKEMSDITIYMYTKNSSEDHVKNIVETKRRGYYNESRCSRFGFCN